MTTSRPSACSFATKTRLMPPPVSSRSMVYASPRARLRSSTSVSAICHATVEERALGYWLPAVPCPRRHPLHGRLDAPRGIANSQQPLCHSQRIYGWPMSKAETRANRERMPEAEEKSRDHEPCAPDGRGGELVRGPGRVLTGWGSWRTGETSVLSRGTV